MIKLEVLPTIVSSVLVSLKRSEDCIFGKVKQLDFSQKVQNTIETVLLMPLAKTIEEFVSFILKGVDFIDHTSISLLRTINQYVTLIMCKLS